MFTFFIINVFSVQSLTAQSIARQVVSLAGSNLSNGTSSLNFTLGEPAATTMINGEQLTSGFQQAWASVTAVNDPANQLTDVNVYPNPTFGILTIQSTESLTVNIFNVNGQLVSEENLDAGNRQINIGTQPAGMYYVQLVHTATDRSKTFKLTKLE